MPPAWVTMSSMPRWISSSFAVYLAGVMCHSIHGDSQFVTSCAHSQHFSLQKKEETKMGEGKVWDGADLDEAEGDDEHGRLEAEGAQLALPIPHVKVPR